MRDIEVPIAGKWYVRTSRVTQKIRKTTTKRQIAKIIGSINQQATSILFSQYGKKKDKKNNTLLYKQYCGILKIDHYYLLLYYYQHFSFRSMQPTVPPLTS